MTAFCLGVIVGVLLTLAYFGRFFYAHLAVVVRRLLTKICIETLEAT